MSTHPMVPGEPTKTGTTMLETATAAVQKFGPINGVSLLRTRHDTTGRGAPLLWAPKRRNAPVPNLRQPEADARLIGVEYIVSENLFMTLPDAEKKMWHSHEYEVKSGVLFLPGVPGAIQRQDLAKVAQTYGKTIHFWQVDRGDNLPLGLPQVMMALTHVEKRFNVNFDKERENRAYMKGLEHGIHPLANAGGKGLKTELREVDCHGGAGAHATPRVFV
ncbi:Oil body-associated protein 1A [Bienertia sinuspersici]